MVYLLNNTESKSLIMEIAKAIVKGFNNNVELVTLATVRVSKFLVKAS